MKRIHFQYYQLLALALVSIIWNAGNAAATEPRHATLLLSVLPTTFQESESALVQAYTQIAARNFVAAEDILLDARRSDPINQWIGLNLGLIYLTTGRPTLADLEYHRLGQATLPSRKFYAVILDENTENNKFARHPAARRHLAQLQMAWKASESKLIDSLPTAKIHRTDEAATSKQNSTTLHLDTEAIVAQSQCPLQSAIEEINAWANAWKTRDINRYLASYRHDFRGTYSHSDQWRKTRMQLILRSKNIDLKLSNLSVAREQHCVVVATFRQDYRSDHFRDIGIKRLHLSWEQGRWLITQESFVA